MASVDDEPNAAASMLREALAMWRGHPYADVDGRTVFEPEITRLGELCLSALGVRIDADLAVGRHRELVGELEALTVEHPLRERLRAQEMLALYRSAARPRRCALSSGPACIWGMRSGSTHPRNFGLSSIRSSTTTQPSTSRPFPPSPSGRSWKS